MALLVKTLDGLAYASVKTRRGLAVASIKNINGLDASGGTAALIANRHDNLGIHGGTSGSIDSTGANFAVVAAASYPPAGQVSISDSKSNSWNALTGYADAGLTRVQLFWTQGGTFGSGHTFTLGVNDSYSSLAIYAFSNIAASPFDQVSGGASVGANPYILAGSITPVQANTVWISALGQFIGTGLDPSVDSGLTKTDYEAGDADSLSVAFAYAIVTSAAAKNVRWDISAFNGAPLVVSAATFKY